jgi:uncharacterized damage-inducible protein DinB
VQAIQELLTGLKNTPAILRAFVATIPAERLDRRRGDADFWTIAEHVSHLAQVQPMMLERFERFVEEGNPAFVPYIPVEDDKPETIEMASALDQFAKVRQAQLALLASQEAAAWKKIGTHPEYEQYSLFILVRHLLMHDFWHMYRMEELWLTRDPWLTKLV